MNRELDSAGFLLPAEYGFDIAFSTTFSMNSSYGSFVANLVSYDYINASHIKTRYPLKIT